MSRTSNSIKNITYSLIAQIINLLCNFINRTVFVYVLGAEYLGINGLFTNILTILSFAELGIGTAIIYSLYEPLSQKDESKIKALMNLYKKAYNSIGIIILVVGAALTPFLEFFIKDMPDIPYIRLIYLMYVANSGFSYFFSYKRSFLIADQKKYIDTFYQSVFFLLRTISQIAILLITKDFILYLGVQILLTLIENIVVSRKIDKLYPFLKEKNNEQLQKEDRQVIVNNVKALILHRVGDVTVNGTDNILISKFVGIIQVGLYSNYLLITNTLNGMFRIIFQSITASIGNMGVTEKKEKNIFIFNCIDLFGMWIYGFATICLFVLFNPFIEIWLGEEYLFRISVILIIIVSFYLKGRRQSVLTFKDAFGLFWYDRYKPVLEAVTNLILSLILVKFMGIEGILLGTVISSITTVFWIEPYVLYKYGFKSSVKPYFVRYIVSTIVMVIAGGITLKVANMFSGGSVFDFIGKMLVCMVIPNLIFLCVVWRTQEFQYLFGIIKGMFMKVLKKVNVKPE